MKQKSGIQIAPTLFITAIHGLLVVIMPALVRLRVRSIRTTAMVLRTPTSRGVGFLWREARSALLLYKIGSYKLKKYILLYTFFNYYCCFDYLNLVYQILVLRLLLAVV